jgi:signal transduction histidine kinase
VNKLSDLQRKSCNTLTLSSNIKLLKAKLNGLWVKNMDESKRLEQQASEQSQMVLQCKHSSGMLLNLINDLLDLAKQERLTFQLNRSYFNLIDTIKSTFSTLEFLAQHKKVKTKLLVDPT